MLDEYKVLETRRVLCGRTGMALPVGRGGRSVLLGHRVAAAVRSRVGHELNNKLCRRCWQSPPPGVILSEAGGGHRQWRGAMRHFRPRWRLALSVLGNAVTVDMRRTASCPEWTRFSSESGFQDPSLLSLVEVRGPDCWCGTADFDNPVEIYVPASFASTVLRPPPRHLVRC